MRRAKRTTHFSAEYKLVLQYGINMSKERIPPNTNCVFIKKP